MSVLKSVAISGTVGVQVFATTVPTILKGITITPGAASAAVVTVRDGNASGEIRWAGIAPAKSSIPFEFDNVRFDKGMHVKVIGTGGAAYLELD